MGVRIGCCSARRQLGIYDVDAPPLSKHGPVRRAEANRLGKVREVLHRLVVPHMVQQGRSRPVFLDLFTITPPPQTRFHTSAPKPKTAETGEKDESSKDIQGTAIGEILVLECARRERAGGACPHHFVDKAEFWGAKTPVRPHQERNVNAHQYRFLILSSASYDPRMSGFSGSQCAILSESPASVKPGSREKATFLLSAHALG